MNKLRATSHQESHPWKPQGQRNLPIQLLVEEQMTRLGYESRQAATFLMGQEQLTALHGREEVHSGSEHKAEGRAQGAEPYE